MHDEHAKGAADGGVPWAFVLDPAANARALGDVQRRGLQAARELVDRVVSSIEGGGGASTGAHDAQHATTLGGHEGFVRDVVQAWCDVAAFALSSLAGQTDGGRNPAWRGRPSDASLTVDLTGEAGPTLWRLHADRKGELSDPAALWLRNPGSEPIGPLRVRVGDLYTSDGARIESREVEFDPSEIDELAPRGAQGVVAGLSPQEPMRPGRYRGIVHIDDAPQLCVILEVAVHEEP
jgi:hypothetical protein